MKGIAAKTSLPPVNVSESGFANGRYENGDFPFLEGFRPKNREILASLPWQPRPLCLHAGLPARGWAAKVPDDHPAWKLWRLNRTVMEQRGYRAATDAAGDWCLEFWVADEEAASQSREQSVRVSSDLDVPAPAGLSYYAFQRAGVEFLASRPAALLSDEMGCGKTVEIAGLLNLSQKTVEFHKHHVMEAFNLESNAAMVIFALKQGLISQKP